MFDKIKLIFLVFCFTSLLYSQEIKFPNFALSNVEFQVDPVNQADSIKSIEVFDANSSFKFDVDPSKEKEIKIKITSSGLYQIKINGELSDLKIRIIPGWLSILPPLLAIFLALLSVH